MPIQSKKELQFYIKADRLINRGWEKISITNRIKHIFFPDYIMRFLVSMRWISYLSNKKRKLYPHLLLLKIYHEMRFRKLGVRLGYTIGPDCFGYGLCLPHYGTIIVGHTNKIGNYACLHPCTCITNMNSQIGNGLFMGVGSKIIKEIIAGNNISIGANSVVLDNVDSNNLMVGIPAKKFKLTKPWYEEDSNKFLNRIKKIENLKLKFQ